MNLSSAARAANQFDASANLLAAKLHNAQGAKAVLQVVLMPIFIEFKAVKLASNCTVLELLVITFNG